MTGQRISILGIDIYYVSLGTGFPIVYVHGNTGSSRWFEKVADIPGYRTIALDLPNFGRSGALGRSRISIVTPIASWPLSKR
jgi:Predicted hydrolases or acyltransferases (alpha/beta hydrolase superfamily)